MSPSLPCQFQFCTIVVVKTILYIIHIYFATSYYLYSVILAVEQSSKWKDVRSPLLEKIPTIIKTMVADEAMLYIGTSQGMVVTIPIASLGSEDSTTSKQEIEDGEMKENGNTANDTDKGLKCLNNCALALHVQKDSRVKSLLHLQLPVHPQSTDADSQFPNELHNLQQHSLSDVKTESSLAETSTDFRSYRSLVISAGKGHMEYSDNPAAEDTLKLPPNYNTLREKNEEHQLLVWGRKL